MDKPLSQWTLKEASDLCKNRGKGTSCCRGCQFLDDVMEICVISKTPEDWYFPEENDVPAASDTNAADKPTKPRLAEVLGVDVGETFRVQGVNVRFFVDECGMPKIYDGDSGLDIEGMDIYKAINHPESIIRAPRLTEAELAICKAVGAKWVSEDGCSDAVVLWATKPSKRVPGVYSGQDADLLARVNYRLFPSVHPLDCICVEEAQHDA